jgi:hypothetical protein
MQSMIELFHSWWGKKVHDNSYLLTRVLLDEYEPHRMARWERHTNTTATNWDAATARSASAQ